MPTSNVDISSPHSSSVQLWTLKGLMRRTINTEGFKPNILFVKRPILGSGHFRITPRASGKHYQPNIFCRRISHLVVCFHSKYEALGNLILTITTKTTLKNCLNPKYLQIKVFKPSKSLKIPNFAERNE